MMETFLSLCSFFNQLLYPLSVSLFPSDNLLIIYSPFLPFPVLLLFVHSYSLFLGLLLPLSITLYHFFLSFSISFLLPLSIFSHLCVTFLYQTFIAFSILLSSILSFSTLFVCCSPTFKYSFFLSPSFSFPLFCHTIGLNYFLEVFFFLSIYEASFSFSHCQCSHLFLNLLMLLHSLQFSFFC